MHFGRKYGFRQASTDVPSLLADTSCNTVVIATRHDSHASLVQQALAAGKHVFVEKPLCLTAEELTAIEAAYTGEYLLMVGFNRRFAPLLIELQQRLTLVAQKRLFTPATPVRSPLTIGAKTQLSVAAGAGEGYHFVDLLRHLADSPIEDLQLLCATDGKPCPDTFSLQLRFADGSIDTVHYFANGSKSFPKERLEVFAAGNVLCLDNYRKLKAWGFRVFVHVVSFLRTKARRLVAQPS